MPGGSSSSGASSSRDNGGKQLSITSMLTVVTFASAPGKDAVLAAAGAPGKRKVVATTATTANDEFSLAYDSEAEQPPKERKKLDRERRGRGERLWMTENLNHPERCEPRDLSPAAARQIARMDLEEGTWRWGSLYAKCKAHVLALLNTDFKQMIADSLSKGNLRLNRKKMRCLIERAAELGATPCTCGSCEEVKPNTCFTKSGLKKHLCKECASPAGVARSIRHREAQREQLAAQHQARPEARNNGKLEDLLGQWFVKKLRELVPDRLSGELNREFRLGDVVLQLAGCALCLGLQLKTATAPKPGKQATFNYCLGYEDLPVLCATVVLNEAGTEVVDVPNLWLVKGREIEKNELATSRANPTILAPTTLNATSVSVEAAIDQLIDWFTESVESDAPVFPLKTEEELQAELCQGNQRKEAFTMQAFRHAAQAPFKLEPTTGFQTATDAKIKFADNDKVFRSQHKAIGFDVRHTNARTIVAVRHNSKGRENSPYDEGDFDVLVPQLVVKNVVNGVVTYYLLYAIVPMEELAVERLTNKRDNRTAAVVNLNKDGVVKRGKASIDLPLGKYAQWLTGKDAPTRMTSATKWLKEGTAFGLRTPILVTPEADGPSATLTRAVLDEISYEAKKPELLAELL